MDTTAAGIQIHAHGCNFCDAYDAEIRTLPKFQSDAQQRLNTLVEGIRERGRRSPYDCVIGLSGGVDSSYVAHLVKQELKLRPLAVHLDNGWNDELAVHNIEKVVRMLKLDLVTFVLQWREFSSIQKAFLRASTPDCEIPTDHAIAAALRQTALRFGIRTIISGNNRVTEAIMPAEWSQGHSKWGYIRHVARQYGDERLSTYPHTTSLRRLITRYVSRIQSVRILSYVPFNKVQAEQFLKDEFGWEPYAGKHYESVYTKFFQGYLLPRKFGFDKRKAHLSNLICANQISRNAALEILSTPPLDEDESEYLLEYVADKFGWSEQDLREVIAAPPRKTSDVYANQPGLSYRFARSVYRTSLKPILQRFA